MIESKTPPMRLAWLVWGLGAIFYLMGFFQRVAPAVITTELMKEFDINAAAAFGGCFRLDAGPFLGR